MFQWSISPPSRWLGWPTALALVSTNWTYSSQTVPTGTWPHNASCAPPIHVPYEECQRHGRSQKGKGVFAGTSSPLWPAENKLNKNLFVSKFHTLYEQVCKILKLLLDGTTDEFLLKVICSFKFHAKAQNDYTERMWKVSEIVIVWALSSFAPSYAPEHMSFVKMNSIARKLRGAMRWRTAPPLCPLLSKPPCRCSGTH